MSGMVLCGTSAEKVLEREALKKGYGLEPTSSQELLGPIPIQGMSAREWSIQIDGIEFTHLDLLIGDHKDFRRCVNIDFHQWLGSVPPDGIFKIAEPYANEFYVTSAPFMALIAARRMSLIKLAQYVMYLCGYYCIHQKAPLEERGPLTNKDEIETAIRFVRGQRGWRRLSRVLPYCAEGVRSPQEANYYIVATFPRKLGGYELTKPEVNACIPLNAEHAALAGAPEIEVDFYWKDANIVVEYNGLDSHDGGITPLDITQQVILKEKGIDVLFVTKAQLYNARLLDMMMRQLADRLGMSPENGWPSPEKVENLLSCLLFEPSRNRRVASPEMQREQKRWIRRRT